jgi:pimeloyl-ACP methyl ester carboxylesterase
VTLLLAAGCGAAGKPALSDRLHPCAAEGPNDAWCGTFTVFEDRQAGSGRQIPLHIVVLPSLSDQGRAAPLVFLAGGPGQGAAVMAELVGAAFARVRRHRDIVLVDQRGTGRSHPLDCPAGDDSLSAAFANEDEVLRLLEACLATLDADVRFYTTSLAMDDLDDVRRHLGYEQINLYGGSYGTRAALVYLRRHGAHVRSVVLDGAAPTDMRLPLFSARDAERALGALLTDCDADEACRSAHPGLSGRVRALIARLDNHPARVRLIHPRTGVPDTVDVTAQARSCPSIRCRPNSVPAVSRSMSPSTMPGASSEQRTESCIPTLSMSG